LCQKRKILKRLANYGQSLLNVEGNIFFAVLARRLTTYMTANDSVDRSVQEGGIPGFAGCIEHTSIISQLIGEAKVNRGDLTVAWLNFANAYGRIPHKLIEEALEHYHVPEHVQGMIRSYFSGFQLRFSVGDYTKSWQKLEKGIVTGCTVSVILFVMEMIIKAGGGKPEEQRLAQTSANHQVVDLWMT